MTARVELPEPRPLWKEAVSAPLPASGKYSLQLFVTGNTPRSRNAITRIKDICETHLAGHYVLEIIDIYQQPARARKADIVAIPTLIKKRPLPPCRLVGSLVDTTRVLHTLNLHPQAGKTGQVERGAAPPHP